MPSLDRLVPRLCVALAATALAVPALASCGGGDSVSSSPTDAATAQGGRGGQGGRGPRGGQGGQGGQGRMPGVNGQIAAVEGPTLQVQGNNQQTAVKLGADTTIRQSKAATLAAVTVGSCVTVRAADGNGSTATGLTAASIEVYAATPQGCTGQGGPGGWGGPGGPGRPTGTRTGRPSDAPTQGGQDGQGGQSGRGQGGRGQGGFGRGGVTGRVTAVDGQTITVEPTLRGQGGQDGQGAQGGTSTGSSGGTGAAAAPQQITTTPSTTYTSLVPAAAADLTAGRCVSAMGKSDDTGALSATSITVRDAVGGACGGGRPQGGTGTATTGSVG